MVGLLPQGFSEKVAGLKEEAKGKILHKPELVQHGHDLRTGDLKKQELDKASHSQACAPTFVSLDPHLHR
jgi:hypothetical protein